ncbi:xanthine dehydrogenase family protein molybdopterin-binding subunit [Salinicoccus halodurans]|uniref:2-furoyl-CoA dehydrogenase large subunit n=1 Tax=Salinicoccus halodurans TaxID=407035 RepID=A0A0F7HKD3_9STAP|nr:xanthine dehydrogenase family protein molybdopterin-binding subunit [Salinicoccus halodurans]AKG73542.1 carbon monoxide dehydrogenase [Salinicoccus halodurans]SFK52294.1 2-furoyl-CoA dehydrogenase large subunit [Salinicoccus halodurans]
MGSKIGESKKRVEDARLMAGEGTYIDDLQPFGNIHHAAILRSPYSHAKIKNIHIDEALKIKGVIGIVSGKEVAELSRPFPVGVSEPVEYYSLAIDKVRFVGEGVAVVVAKNRYIAEDALDKIKVEYETLDTVVDVEKAMEHDAPILHENLKTNVVNHRFFDYGETDQAFEEADIVISKKFKFPKYSATPVENYGIIADFKASEEQYTVWSNFHGPFTLHSVMTAALKVSGHQLRLQIPKDIGGSYGIKSGSYPYIVLMSIVSRVVGVPVKWIEDRQENLLASSSGTDRVTWIDAAVKNDGTVTGLRMKMADNVGGYIRAPEPANLYRTHSNSTGAYNIKNLQMETIAVMTNKSPTGLIRGYGGPQLYFPLERMMEIIARKLNMDPADLIKKNLIPADSFPYRTASGGIYDSGNYQGALNKALELIDYEEFRKRQKEALKKGKYLGVGLACIVEPSGSNMGYVTIALTPEERAQGLPKSGSAEGATVSIDPKGSINVRISTVPTGQGHETVASQIVSDVLGADDNSIKVYAEMDTATSPWSVASGSYSSRFGPIGSSAVYEAAKKVRNKLLKIAEHQLNVPIKNLSIDDGKVFDKNEPDKSISMKRLIGTAHWNTEALPAGMEAGIHETAFYNIESAKAPNADDTVNGSATHGFVVDAVTVEVDETTGEVNILDYITVHDAGKLLNPKIADGQILGGLAHGFGGAMFEELVYDEKGQLLSGSFMDYLCPTSTEMPKITINHQETPSPLTPLGAKGLGEGNTMSAPAVISNAVNDALRPLDVVINKLPLAPNMIWKQISEKKQKMKEEV